MARRGRNISYSDGTQADLNRASGWRTIRRVAPYLWPQGQAWVKWRVVVAMVMLVAAKVVAVATPFFFKTAVDTLAGETPDGTTLLLFGAVGLTIAYGVARLMTIGLQQLRDVIFARVGQRALRALALETFTHIHALSLRYHITRKTGGLSRIIERGVKGVEFLLRFLLFSIGPLILELAMIGVILAVVFDIWYLVVVLATIVLYTWFTFKVTEWRVQIRKEMNKQDTEANQKAIDSLGTENRFVPWISELWSSVPDQWRAGYCHGDVGDRGWKRRPDRRRFCHGQRLHDPDHHAAELPRYGLS
jgi:ATP-binding cassette subfamily B protein